MLPMGGTLGTPPDTVHLLKQHAQTREPVCPPNTGLSAERLDERLDDGCLNEQHRG